MNYLPFMYDKYKNLIIKPTFRKSRIDNEFLIIMSNKLEIIYLTDTAKDMILTISDGIKVDELFQKTFSEYEIDESTLKSDIIDFIKDMQWKDIISLENRACFLTSKK